MDPPFPPIIIILLLRPSPRVSSRRPSCPVRPTRVCMGPTMSHRRRMAEWSATTRIITTVAFPKYSPRGDGAYTIKMAGGGTTARRRRRRRDRRRSIPSRPRDRSAPRLRHPPSPPRLLSHPPPRCRSCVLRGSFASRPWPRRVPPP